jgi:hypothetical protein
MSDEIASLLEIWKSMRESTQQLQQTKTPQLMRKKSTLPEPPGRELLEKKIQLLLGNIDGGDDALVESPREKNIGKKIFNSQFSKLSFKVCS